MARKRLSKGKITKAKPAAKKRLVAKGKPAPKKKAAARAKTSPLSRTLESWEIQLRDNYLPAIQSQVNVIMLGLASSDHNRGPVLVILQDLQDLINELQSPSSDHHTKMRDEMQGILEIEPSVSPDNQFQHIPNAPSSTETYTHAIRDQFKNAWNLTWDIYARMDGTEQRTAPTAPDAPTQILQYAADIKTCIDDMHPEFLAVHQRKQSK
jgi:hypothetical protein